MNCVTWSSCYGSHYHMSEAEGLLDDTPPPYEPVERWTALMVFNEFIKRGPSGVLKFKVDGVDGSTLIRRVVGMMIASAIFIIITICVGIRVSETNRLSLEIDETALLTPSDMNDYQVCATDGQGAFEIYQHDQSRIEPVRRFTSTVNGTNYPTGEYIERTFQWRTNTSFQAEICSRSRPATMYIFNSTAHYKSWCRANRVPAPWMAAVSARGQCRQFYAIAPAASNYHVVWNNPFDPAGSMQGRVNGRVGEFTSNLPMRLCTVVDGSPCSVPSDKTLLVIRKGSRVNPMTATINCKQSLDTMRYVVLPDIYLFVFAMFLVFISCTRYRRLSSIV